MGLVTYTAPAPGVTAFAWRCARDHGDGLLVDVDTAGPSWCDVADVLLWPRPAAAATVRARAARVHATLAVVAQLPGHWALLTVRGWGGPDTTSRAVTQWAFAADAPTLLRAIVERYRAVVSGDGPRGAR